MRRITKFIATKISGGGRGGPGEVEEPLSPGARMFHQKGLNVYSLAIVGSNSKVDVDVLKANFPHTLLKHPRFSSLVVGDVSKGEELRWMSHANPDPLDHIIVSDIGPEAEANPDKYLEHYVYNLSKSSLDRSKPLWEVHIINLKTSHAESTSIFRIHHSLGDGTSLISLLLACTRQAADPTMVPTVPASRTHGRRTLATPALAWWRQMMATVWVMMVMWWNTMVDVTTFFASSYCLKDTITPLKGGPRLEFTPRRVVFRTVSLNDIKLIKDVINGTVNDVALGITQAGMSRYLNRKYGDDEKKNNLPRDIRLRSALAFNIRPSAGIQELADMMEKNTKARWGNLLGFVLLPFSIGLQDDPLDYVRKAKNIIDRKKCSLEAVFTFTLCRLSIKLFGIKATVSIFHKVLSNTTLVFSNIVGPMEEIEFFGHHLLFMAPTSYGLPQALMIHFQSWVDKVTIVLSVDEDTIPDPSRLCDDIVESLNLIKNEVTAKRCNVI